MFNNRFFLIAFFFSLTVSVYSPIFGRAPRILVLIISSDTCLIDGCTCGIYPKLQSVWKQYMHSNPQQVDSYFIRCASTLSNEFEIQDDTIWTQGTEGWPLEGAGTNGIIVKTVRSFEAILPILDEFDYVLRTCLSSFYDFPGLLRYTKTLPKNHCYSGFGEGFGSGSGFLLSPDLIRLIVENKQWFIDFRPVADDDVLIAHFLKQFNIPLISHARQDVLCIEDWNKIKNNLPEKIFQFRIKNSNHLLRITDDASVYKDLLKKYYP